MTRDWAREHDHDSDWERALQMKRIGGNRRWLVTGERAHETARRRRQTKRDCKKGDGGSRGAG